MKLSKYTWSPPKKARGTRCLAGGPQYGGAGLTAPVPRDILADMEIWKQVPGYPDYSVSSFGQVTSIKSGRLQFLKPRWLSSGKRGGIYLAFNVRGGSRQTKTIKLHRIVAELFIGPVPPDRPIVMHLDEDKTNNRWDNLQYGTQLENVQRYEVHMRSLGFIRIGFNEGWYNSNTGESRL